ncbi:hypothetical protein N7468_008523 [Penicillium chermesinum]|uniref:Nudix hydrolase domain-containing protein n=1 Tax=Penicillium chermesinum TaxID=63820 RepID=A0A9W9NPX2_9EURO|nr:uncharacterized protein N7468_008523 [Penicillium chermesinum]KAJ5223981.1 hypothetical protein N7468_008523 [Penicillium chermesinum]
MPTNPITSPQQSPGTRASEVHLFIFSVVDGEPRVALFRRSENARTLKYVMTDPMYHTPICGAIEPNEPPTAAAWRALKQHAGLTSHAVEFSRKGKPFISEDNNAELIICPFAFRLRAPGEGSLSENAIALDDEHTEWSWHNPDIVVHNEADLSIIPNTSQSLRRVWFEADMNKAAGEALRSGLEQLKTDHKSGANELASIALKSFRDVLMHLHNDPNWWETARKAAWHLWKNGRESMGAATLNVLLHTLAELRKTIGNNLEEERNWDRSLAAVDYQLEERRKIDLRIKESFTLYLQANFLPPAKARSCDTLSILTLSASSTIRDSILDAFAALPIPRLDLRILESRPLFEEVPPSSDRSLNMTIYTDASAALASADVDFALLGADRISHLGDVSNKTGSLPAVLSAKHVHPEVKVLVLSGLDKIAEPGTEHEVENNDRTEIISSWLANGGKGVKVIESGLSATQSRTNCIVEVKNIYFEWVPRGLIDEYICEEGIWNESRIYHRAVEIEYMIHDYFGSI